MEETLGKRISANRKKLKLTQDQLAEQLGVTAQAVSKWENDQSCPDITILPQLADIFGISTDELLGRESQQFVFEGKVVDEKETLLDNDIVLHHIGDKQGAIALAFFVLLVGTLALLAKLLSWDVSFWNILWPSALLVFGLSGVFTKFSVFSLGISLFGGYFLINNLGIWTLDIASELIFPIVILLFGLSLLIDALRKPRKPHFSFTYNSGESKKAHSNLTESHEHFDCSVSFCENTYTVTLPRLSSGDASLSFGELTLDLTQCDEIVSGCELKLSCSFGELTILVPKSCRIVSDISTAFGSTEFVGQPEADASTILNVDGSASFGSIEIRYI